MSYDRNERYKARSQVRALVDDGATATINGKSAVIRGYGDEFATVHEYRGIGKAEYAWETVLFILTKHDGRFEA